MKGKRWATVALAGLVLWAGYGRFYPATKSSETHLPLSEPQRILVPPVVTSKLPPRVAPASPGAGAMPADGDELVCVNAPTLSSGCIRKRDIYTIDRKTGAIVDARF